METHKIETEKNANKKDNAKIFKYFPHLFDQDLFFTNIFPKLCWMYNCGSRDRLRK